MGFGPKSFLRPVGLRTSGRDHVAVPGPQGRAAREFLITRNAHPPSSVLLALPLARLNYPDAFLAWSLISLAALALSLWIVVRHLGIPFSAWSLAPTLTLLLVCNPIQPADDSGTTQPHSAPAPVGRLGRRPLAPTRDGRSMSGRGHRDQVVSGIALRLLPPTASLDRARLGHGRPGATDGPDGGRVRLLRSTKAMSAWRCPKLRSTAIFGPTSRWPGFWLKLFEGRSGRTVPLWYNPTLARVADPRLLGAGAAPPGANDPARPYPQRQRSGVRADSHGHAAAVADHLGSLLRPVAVAGGGCCGGNCRRRDCGARASECASSSSG